MKSIVRIEKIMEYSLVISCLGLTAWQIWKGITKYMANQQGASLSFEKISDVSLPDFTICPESDDSNKTSVSEVCNLQSDQWKSEICPDPELNFKLIFETFNAVKSVAYFNGTCHPTTCFKVRRFRLYPNWVPA